ncbi:unnamed protein product, partial [Adineta ricciae]
MATFSSTPSSTAVTNALSTASSLSYHHLLSASNGNNNNNNNNSSNSTSSDENLTPINPINDINLNNTFDSNTSYLNNTDFSLCLPSTQQTTPFDAVVATSTSPLPFNNDPLVRHFFNYRQQNDANLTGNYYPNMSSGSFVNAFDYSYANMAPSSIAPNLGSDPSLHNHAFPTSNSSQHHSHAHPFVNSYISYPHSQQQILKPTDSFAMPIQQPHAHPQSHHHQQQQQQQNIYPWMRRIHNTC